MGRTTDILTQHARGRHQTGHRPPAPWPWAVADIAGNTGTTNESKDAWFSGYNADYVTTVWTGFDQPESLGRKEFGGTVALPDLDDTTWAQRSRASRPTPSQSPKASSSLRVDPISGRAATPSTPGAYFELFKAEDTPPSVNELGNGNAPAARCQRMKRRRSICSDRSHIEKPRLRESAGLFTSPFALTTHFAGKPQLTAFPVGAGLPAISSSSTKPSGINLAHHAPGLLMKRYSCLAVEHVIHAFQRVVLRIRQGRYTGLDRGLGHSIGDHGDQAGIHWLRNDVLTTELQLDAAVGVAHFLRHWQLGQFTQGVGSSRSFISSLMRLARTSRAPRKMNGKPSTLLTWFG